MFSSRNSFNLARYQKAKAFVEETIKKKTQEGSYGLLLPTQFLLLFLFRLPLSLRIFSKDNAFDKLKEDLSHYCVVVHRDLGFLEFYW